MQENGSYPETGRQSSSPVHTDSIPSTSASVTSSRSPSPHIIIKRVDSPHIHSDMESPVTGSARSGEHNDIKDRDAGMATQYRSGQEDILTTAPSSSGNTRQLETLQKYWGAYSQWNNSRQSQPSPNRSTQSVTANKEQAPTSATSAPPRQKKSTALSLSIMAPEGNPVAGPDLERTIAKKSYKRNDDKPPYSYVALIIMAIDSIPSKKATLKQVKTKLCDMFEFFNGEYTGWYSSVRHAMSSSKCFYKFGHPLVVNNCPSYFWKINWRFVTKNTFLRQKKTGMSVTYKQYLFEELGVPMPQQDADPVISQQGSTPVITTVCSDEPEAAMKLPNIPRISDEIDTTVALSDTDDFLNARRDSDERPRTAPVEIDADITCNALPSYVIDLDTPKSGKRKADYDEKHPQVKRPKLRVTEKLFNISRRHSSHPRRDPPQQTTKHTSSADQPPAQIPQYDYTLQTISLPNQSPAAKFLQYEYYRPGSIASTSGSTWSYLDHTNPSQNMPRHAYMPPQYSVGTAYPSYSMMANTYPTQNMLDQAYMSAAWDHTRYSQTTSPFFYNHHTRTWQHRDTWTADAYSRMHTHFNGIDESLRTSPVAPIDLSVKTTK